MFSRFTFFWSVILFLSSGASAYDVFHPEADGELKEQDTWSEVTFKKDQSNTETKTAFRVRFPFAARDVWGTLINTNEWKNIHSDYTDSRTLNRNQYELIAQKKPSSVKAFYEIIGEQTYPSEHGRIKGGTWTSYVFQRFNMPWPLKDRWNVIKIKNIESNSAQNEYRYEYKMLVGNFKELKGFWELVPVPGKPGWSEFRGEYHVDPGIDVPHFLAKNLYKSSVKRNFKENAEVLEKMGATKAK